MLFEPLEPRQLFSLGVDLPRADLLADSNRDGVIDALDQKREDIWTSGRRGRGALVLPNFDKDNTATEAPDNWTGGVWNGSPVAPNHIIDNAADLLDIGELRMRKLGNVDAAYNYRVTLRLLSPMRDPAWFRKTSAAQRIRLFFPTDEQGDDVVCQAGDVAVIGPGLGDTIVFVSNPAGTNEFSVLDLAGDGDIVFGVEGVKAGAAVRFELTIEYVPIIVSTSDADADASPPSTSDVVAMRVAPFVVMDNQQRIEKVIVEDMSRYGIDNSDLSDALDSLFGSDLIESRSGDLWQQDGYEIGYAKTPYGAMPMVLELPRARDYFFDTDYNMRSFIRGTLLDAGVGVSTELAALPNISSSAYGGDIESLPRPGKPGFLLASNMPRPIQRFFEAQGVNPLLDLKLDDWLGVAHVDEVVHLASSGEKVIIADPDIAWALTLWAIKLNPNVRMLPGMNGNSDLPDSTADGIKASFFLSNETFRQQNLDYVQSNKRLRGVYDAVKEAMGLTDDVTSPKDDVQNKGTATMLRGGAFTQMLGNLARTYEVRFVDSNRYQLRYRDAGGSYSQWFDGRKSRDEVFPEARAFLLKDYWKGQAKAGDRFTFQTNPDATLIKMPALFATAGLFYGDPGFTPWRLAAFSTNHINSIADGDTIVTGNTYGPRVDWDGNGDSDLFQSYVESVFTGAGYNQVVFTDSRLYHDSGGGLHCGTNAIREVPTDSWWNLAGTR